MNKIDCVYYINLKTRKDRNYLMLSELKRMDVKPEKIKRIQGTFNRDGHIGCTKSHIQALTDAVNNNYSNFLVLEDDYIFTQELSYINNVLNKFFDEYANYNVATFYASNWKLDIGKINDYLSTIIKTCSTAGYMVSGSYAKTLLTNFTESYDKISVTYDHEKYCLDQYWEILQKQDMWYCFYPNLGTQRAGFSDIAKCNVNYECEISKPENI